MFINLQCLTNKVHMQSSDMLIMQGIRRGHGHHSGTWYDLANNIYIQNQLSVTEPFVAAACPTKLVNEGVEICNL